jgi:streptogramin lyase
MNKKVEIDYRPHGRYFGSNFLNEIGSTVMEKGTAIMGLHPDLQIETINTSVGSGARAMVGDDTSTLLVNLDGQLTLLNLTHHSWTHIEDRYVPLRELSPFISKNGRIWMSYAQPNKGNLLSFNPDDNKIDLFPIETGFEQFVFINDEEIAPL